MLLECIPAGAGQLDGLTNGYRKRPSRIGKKEPAVSAKTRHQFGWMTTTPSDLEKFRLELKVSVRLGHDFYRSGHVLRLIGIFSHPARKHRSLRRENVERFWNQFECR
jgi:hypothetical protein